jgi:branched-chain amino acid transport system ATP-binding protein
MSASPALKLTGVRKSFGKTEIIRGVDLEIPVGERHALIGPNGAGKSTLFHLISARLEVSAGSIELKGQPITGLPPYRINRMGLSRSFQITNIFPRLSVFENIRCATLYALGYKYSFWHRLSRLRNAAERATDIMNQIGLRYRRDTLAANLTYAEQRALEIGITRAESQQAVALIRRMTEGKTLVMVEHDMGVVFDLADRISVLVYGQLIATDKPTAIRANAAVQEAYLGKPVEQAAAR